MRRNTRRYQALKNLLLGVCILMLLTQYKITGYAKEIQERSLIQSTSLQGDYEALISLDLIKTPVIDSLDNQKAFWNILDSCVDIRVNGYSGSGSIYRMTKDEIIIVSNRHLLDFWNEDSYVTFRDGTVGTGSLAGISQTADVGFVRIPIVNFTYEDLLKYKEVRYDKEVCRSLMEGDSFFIPDLFTDLKNPSISNGTILDSLRYIEDFKAQMLYGDAYGKHGMSGSGIFDGLGNYIGMLSGGTDRNEIAGVPADIVYEEYKKIIN